MEQETTAPLSTREAKAIKYLDGDLRGQMAWYGQRARTYKSRAQLLAFLVIAAGAVTTAVQVFGHAAWVPLVTAGLGALVVFAEGWQRIARYSETWASYRAAAERMKREKRLFLNGAGAYRDLDDEAAFAQFVENTEAILAEEQQTFWRERRANATTGVSSTDAAG